MLATHWAWCRDFNTCGRWWWIWAIVDHYGWTHIVLVADDTTSGICWMAAKPFDDVFANNDNYTLSVVQLPQDDQNLTSSDDVSTSDLSTDCVES